MSLGAARASSEARYRIADELARDGAVRVMAAHDQELNRNVALASCGGTRAQQSAFAQQGQAVSRLSSNYLVDIYDCGSHRGLPFVVFERPAYTLVEAIKAGGRGGVVWVDLTDAARELEEAIACLRPAGVELAQLLPGAIGVNESGHVRLSPWPFSSPAEGAGLTVTESELNGEEQIRALLAPDVTTLTPGRTASARLVAQSSSALDAAAPVGAPHVITDRAATFEPSNLTPTAPVTIGRTLLTRPSVSAHTTKRRRRPRTKYLVAAAAVIVAIAGLAAASSVRGQASAPGMSSSAHGDGAAGAHPGRSGAGQAGTEGGARTPNFSQPANEGPTSGPAPTATTSAPLVAPATTSVSSASGLAAAPGSTTTSTTSATSSPSTTTTVAPAATTTVPTSTTTTTVAPQPGP